MAYTQVSSATRYLCALHLASDKMSNSTHTRACACLLFQVVISVTGLDGALLAPHMFARSEAWADLEPILQTLRRKLVSARQAAAASLLESVPVFHATDNYRAQSSKLRAMYSKLAPHCGWQLHATAKKRLVMGPSSLTPSAKSPKWLNVILHQTFGLLEGL